MAGEVVLDRVAIQLVADVQPLIRDMQRAARDTKATGKAAADAARQVKTLASATGDLARQEQLARRAHENFLQNRARQDARAAAEQAAQAAATGRMAAQAQVDAAVREFDRRIGELKLAQVRGLVSPREAERAGREFAQAYNNAVSRALERAPRGSFTGIEGQAAFNQLAGSLKNVQKAGRNAGLGLGRLNNSLVVVARNSLGLSSTAGRLIDTVGTFAIGTAFMIPVLAGLAAIGAAWEKITRDAREARKAQEEALGALRDLQEQRRIEGLGPGGEIREQVAEAEGALERIAAEQERLQQRLRTTVGEATRQAIRDRLQALREEAAEATKIIEFGQREAAQAFARAQVAGAEEAKRAREEAAEAARRAAAEVQRALENQIALLGRAVDLDLARTEEFAALQRIAQDQLAILRDQTRSLEDQVDAAERRRDAEAAINRFLADRLTGPPNAVTEPLVGTRTFPAFDVPLDRGQHFLVPPEELEKALREALVEVERLTEGTGDLGEVAARSADEARALAQGVEELAIADAVVGGLVAVADGLGLVDNASRAWARGLSDVLAGIEHARAAESLTSVAGIGGILGIAGGVAGILGSILGGGDAQRAFEEQRRREIDRQHQGLTKANEELQRFAAALREVTKLEKDRADAERIFRQGVPVQRQAQRRGEDIALPPGLLDDIIESARAWSGELDDVDRIMSRVIADVGKLPPEIEKLLRAFVEGLEAAEAAHEREQARIAKNLEIQTLVAMGLDEEAQALKDQLAIQEAIADGWSDANIAALEYLQTLQAQVRAQREAQRVADLGRDFGVLFAEQMAEAALREGDVDAFREAQRIIGEAQIEQALAPFEELVEQGIISEEAFTLLAATMRGNLNAAIEETIQSFEVAADAAREAAQAERFRQMVDKENLRVQILLAQGRDSEARALEKQLQIIEAIQAGRDAEYIALLQTLQAAQDAERILKSQKRAQDDLNRSIDQTTRALNAPAGLRLSLLRWRALVTNDGPSIQQSTAFAGAASSGTSSSSRPVVMDNSVIVEKIELHPPAGMSGKQIYEEVEKESKRRQRLGGQTLQDVTNR